MADLLGSIGGLVPMPPGVGLIKDLVEGKDASEIGADFLDNSKKMAKSPLVQFGANMACPGAGSMMAIGSSVNL